jgi:hypothetical protein
MTSQSIPHSAEQSGTERQSGAERSSRWVRLPLPIALVAVALVWVGGCVWSFKEQSGFASAKGFYIPWLLPVVIDGLAIALAAVAWAASLDGRPAVFARLGTAIAVAGSATSNAAFAWERSNADVGTVTLAAAVPLAANLAFEVLLAESRRQVLRRRGVPAPVAVPYPRLLRVVLAPWSTFWTWRRLVLEATDLRPLFDAARSASRTAPAGKRSTPAQPAVSGNPAERSAPPPALPAGPAPAPHHATVTPSKRSATRKQSAPVAEVRQLHSRVALADAQTLRAKYDDALPARGAHALVQNEFGWGGAKATNAIKAYRDEEARRTA